MIKNPRNLLWIVPLALFPPALRTLATRVRLVDRCSLRVKASRWPTRSR